MNFRKEVRPEMAGEVTHDAFLPNEDELQDAKSDHQHVRTRVLMYGLRYEFTIVCYQPVSSMRKEARHMPRLPGC